MDLIYLFMTVYFCCWYRVTVSVFQ